MNWMMRAISAPCRIASPRLQSAERRLISSRSKGFSRNRALRHSPTPREFPTRASVRAPTIAPGLPIDRTGRATAFPTAARDRTGPSPSGTEGYRDNRHSRDGRPRDFRPYRNSPTQATREGGADVAASSGLPPFITASPRPTNADPIQDTPSPDAVASPEPTETPESGPPVFRAAVRRKRLSDPGAAPAVTIAIWIYRGDSGESDGPNSTPEIDDSPVRNSRLARL